MLCLSLQACLGSFSPGPHPIVSPLPASVLLKTQDSLFAEQKETLCHVLPLACLGL